jgi:hypothetical protein
VGFAPGPSGGIGAVSIRALARGVRIVAKEIAVEAVLENCRALIKQIKAGLSAEKPFVNDSSAEELLLHLETAAAALKRSFGPRPPEH